MMNQTHWIYYIWQEAKKMRALDEQHTWQDDPNKSAIDQGRPVHQREWRENLNEATERAKGKDHPYLVLGAATSSIWDP